MKIKVLNEDGDIIRVFHHPREVIIKPISKTVEIHEDARSAIIQEFPLLKRQLAWITNPNDGDCMEVYVELTVQQKGQKETPTT